MHQSVSACVRYMTGSLAKPALKYQMINSFSGPSFGPSKSWNLFLNQNVWLQDFGWLCRTRRQALECTEGRGQAEWQHVQRGQGHVTALQDLRHSGHIRPCSYHTVFGEQGDTTELTVYTR